MEKVMVLNGNKTIAKFMGRTYEEIKNDTGDVRYHYSWDWLIPVVEKIESFGYFVKISTKMVSVSRDNKGNNDSHLVIAEFGDKTKFEKLYICVLSTIKYINYLKEKV